jgi:AbrB family looped-hinge helix DNA binding protein
MDKVGRILLPKPIRKKLHLAAGDELELACRGDRITLRPLRRAQLMKKHSVWVFHCGEPLSAATVAETIEQERRERKAGD